MLVKSGMEAVRIAKEYFGTETGLWAITAGVVPGKYGAAGHVRTR